MTLEHELARGFKRNLNISLYEGELKILDALCKKYRCSRASVVGAWAREYENTDLTGKVKAGRRPGAGRKPGAKGTTK